MLTLELQKSAVTCDKEATSAARIMFDAVCAFRNRQKHFPNSLAELVGEKFSAESDKKIPPPNPYVDAKNVSKDLQHELENTFGPAPETCKIIFEHDTSLSSAFPITIKNVKLKPDHGTPGTIVIKYHGDYYVAVWCMGFEGRPVLNAETQLPFFLFKDYSTQEAE